MKVTLEISEEEARKFIHEDLPMNEEQLKECLITYLADVANLIATEYLPVHPVH